MIGQPLMPGVSAELLSRCKTLGFQVLRPRSPLGVFRDYDGGRLLPLVLVGDPSPVASWALVAHPGAIPFVFNLHTWHILHEGAFLPERPGAVWSRGSLWRIAATWVGAHRIALAVLVDGGEPAREEQAA